MDDSRSRDRFVGKTFGSYHIEERLGAGGMGVVYVARDERLRRKVALKMLRPGLANDERRKKRFLREACYAASITHPNVVAVYEASEIYGITYMTMELVPGKSLREWLLRGRLDVDLSLGVARDITRALARAHDQGIVHRDLKPDNVILYEPNPAFVCAKVLDFGLAKAVDPPPSARPRDTDSLSFVTAAGVAVGTAGYMSPEQARGWPVDARSDIYAVGVILHEMLTGQRPAIVDSERTFVAPSLVAPEVTKEIEDLVFRCLARDPVKRFSDATALLGALDAVSPNGAPRALAKTSSARIPQHRALAVTRGRSVVSETNSVRAAITASESETEMRVARMRAPLSVPSLALDPPREAPPAVKSSARARLKHPRLPLLAGSRIPVFIGAAATMFAACFASGRLTAPAMASTATFPAPPPLPAPPPPSPSVSASAVASVASVASAPSASAPSDGPAAPVPTIITPKKPSAGTHAAAPPVIDCSTPFTVDEHGIRVVRRECLRR